MTMHIADNQDALLDYLYGEGDAADRLKTATHLQECAPCSVAVLEFRTVRGMLSEWKPPAATLGFRIVQDSDPAVPPPHDAWRGWAQAAAAIALFVAGMAVSQLNVDYADGALTVRTPAALPGPAARGDSIPLPASFPVNAGSGRPTIPNDTNVAREQSASTEELLQRVRAMIDQSEQRQQRQLALRLTQVAREVDTQHQADLMRIQQNFGQQQEMMDYLVRTSGVVK